MTKRIAADWPAPANVVAGTVLQGGDIGALELSGEPCWLNQVHGAEVVVAGSFESPPAADGSFSADSRYFCVVRSADCLPVLLCCAEGRIVAAAHAGWRGLAAGVIENTIAKMGADPANLLAWLGPAISPAAFEVGDEVRDVFLDQDADAAHCFASNDRGRWQADLYALARQRLSAAGVVQVFGGGFCTFGDEQRFHSYRRDPDCGRMVSFVGLLDR